MDVPHTLLITAASLGFFHTIAGPDHYLPFILMARAGRWSAIKTAAITIACGIGHVAGSVFLGSIGIIFGLSLSHLVSAEELRGGIAAWLLTLFGVLYLIWGLRAAYCKKEHIHVHVHDGRSHSHSHSHSGDHAHVHTSAEAPLTPWIIFTIFVFGPCEVLIPLLMYPAAALDWRSTWLVAVIFALATIGTMTAVVLAGRAGLRHIGGPLVERFAPAGAGAGITLCGAAMVFLDL